MSETRQLVILFLIVILFGAAGFFVAELVNYSGDLTVERYIVTLSPNGSLKETYVYDIGSSGKYTMLYRVWKVPLLPPAASGLNTPYVKVLDVECSFGTISYVKDFAGKVWILSGQSPAYAKSWISRKAYLNEVGCYKPEMFTAGKYTVTYSYFINPPLECDEEICHLNLKLADEHVPYKRVEIVLNDPYNQILRVFPHPPDFSVSKSDSGWVITGKSPRDGLIEVEILLKPGMVGFVKEVSNVEEKTLSANSTYSNVYSALLGLKYILLAIIFGFPAVLGTLYIRYGKEKEFTVPEHLSYVPNKNRKPWHVNLVFKGDALDFDEDGFYATLLDLQIRGFIKIEPYMDGANKKEVKIELLKKPEDAEDPYERAVLQFLHDWSRDGVTFYTGEFKDLVRSMSNKRDEITRLKERVDFIMREAFPEYAREFVESARSRLAVLFVASLVLMLVVVIAGMLYSGTYPVLREMGVYSVAIMLQSLAALLTPTALFGRWKGDYYKEKLEWDAFRKFLSDMVMIKKYAPEDIVIWKDWLIYGTALGVGEKVVKAMEALKVEIPEVYVAPWVYMSFHSVNRSVSSAYAAATGKSTGGGFVSSGGFGGGGAGGR
ncbi:DUF2207 family protein [Archaeoglobus veneficus]|uniref:DUF2207 domain-containing protein n=1 Tax=Archaeoglobus veneficus (strain DSM 11195 / SNP6) TaxID=693661 RepID=F2KQX1_ARCVS|nr:DUF2207 domain-containing protein [Archaeoglobus veneficus]AEA47777.1 Protein of unknown function DUF2207, membrane [Archaeoglobus veneficus SNP6]